MTIYLDIVFLENVCMNYIILFATAIIFKNKPKYLRIIISSILGGMYAIVSLFKSFEIYSGMWFKILISILMVYIAYNPNNFKELIKRLMLFYLTSFAFGGCAFALLYFIKPQEIFMKNGLYIGTYPIKVALLGGFIGFCLIINTFKIIKNKINKRDIYCSIEIEFNNKKIITRSLIDTGNMLRDPISGMPVIVVQKDLLEEMIPKKILDNLDNIIDGEDLNVFNIIENSKLKNKFRLIPFSSLGMQHGLIVGFKAQNVRIQYNEEIIMLKKVIIGIYTKKLSKNNAYTALIGLEALEEEDFKNEHFEYVKN